MNFGREIPDGVWISAEKLLCEGCRKKSNQELTLKKSGAVYRPTRRISENGNETKLPSITEVGKNAVELFLANSKVLKTLSPEETRSLLYRIQENIGSGGDISEEINRLIEANMGFIIHVAKSFYDRAFGKFNPSNADDYFLELVSEAFLSMQRRLSRRPEPGLEGTVVDRVNNIVNNDLMRFAIQKQWGEFARIPVHYSALYSRLIRVRNMLTQKLERDPTENELIDAVMCKACNYDQAIRTIRYIEPLAQSMLYIETRPTNSPSSELSIIDTLYNPDDLAELSALEKDLILSIDQAMSTLPERQRQILYKRYGFKDNVFRTLEEVGNELGLTRERVRQLEALSFRKMRHPSSSKGLYQFLQA